jgi:hypothetical protein
MGKGKDNAAPASFLTATVSDADGNVVGQLVLSAKTFSTGNTGYFGTGKLVVNGKRYQAQSQLAAIRDK